MLNRKKFYRISLFVTFLVYALAPQKVIGRPHSSKKRTASSQTIKFLPRKKRLSHKKTKKKKLSSYRPIWALFGLGSSIIAVVITIKVVQTKGQRSESELHEDEPNDNKRNEDDSKGKKSDKQKKPNKKTKISDAIASFITLYPFVVPPKEVPNDHKDLYDFIEFLIGKVKNNYVKEASELESKFDILLGQFTTDENQKKNITQSLSRLLEYCAPNDVYSIKDYIKELKDNNRFPKVILPLVLSGESLGSGQFSFTDNKGYIHYVINDIWKANTVEKSILLEGSMALTLEGRLEIYKEFIKRGGLAPAKDSSGSLKGRNEASNRSAIVFYLFYKQAGPIIKKIMQRCVQNLEQGSFAMSGASGYTTNFLKDLFKSAQLPISEDIIRNTFKKAITTTNDNITITLISPIKYTIIDNNTNKKYTVSVLGSASIAFALLIEGDEFKPMVVKASYPKISETLQKEYKALNEKLNDDKSKKIITSIYEVAQQEIFFDKERENIHLFNSKHDSSQTKVKTVNVHEDDSKISDKNSLLLLEKAEGSTVSNLLYRCQTKVPNKLTPEEIKALRECLIGYTKYSSERLITQGILHGDTHAGNLIINLKEKLVTEIDLGSIVHIQGEKLEKFKVLLEKISSKVKNIMTVIENALPNGVNYPDFGTAHAHSLSGNSTIISIIYNKLKSDNDIQEETVAKNMAELTKASNTPDEFYGTRVEDDTHHNYKNYIKYVMEYSLLKTYIEQDNNYKYLSKFIHSWHIMYTLVEDWNKNYYNSDYQKEAMGMMYYPLLCENEALNNTV